MPENYSKINVEAMLIVELFDSSSVDEENSRKVVRFDQKVLTKILHPHGY